MENRFDLIIFDWDGTLVDSIDWIVHCFQSAAATNGCLIPGQQTIKDVIGLSIQEAMNSLFSESDQKNQEQIIASYSQEYSSRQMAGDDLFTGVNEMLQILKQKGYQLAVATGKTRLGLDRAMKEVGLSDFFNLTRCADQSASKPKPDMLEDIIKVLSVNKKRVVMVGDSIHDMQMAINAGVSSIAVNCGANSLEQLQQFNPLLNLQQTTELLENL